MYSQYDEEKYILQHFKNKTNGSFLDIGAYNGKTFSNTLALAELGWSGICIEPSPTVFPDLIKNHESHDHVQCIQAALGDTSGEAIFYDSFGDAISTFDLTHKKKWEQGYGSKFKEVKVKTITYEDIINQFGKKWDFINLDIEGLSFEFFTKMPYSMIENASCLCIEYDNKLSEIRDILQPFGYVVFRVHDNAMCIKGV